MRGPRIDIHIRLPEQAIDIVPITIGEWNATERFEEMHRSRL